MAETDVATDQILAPPLEDKEKEILAPALEKTEILAPPLEKEDEKETEVSGAEDQDSKRKELDGSGDGSKAKRQRVDSQENEEESGNGLDKNDAQESNEEQAPHTTEEIQNGNHTTEENSEQTGKEDLSNTNKQHILNDVSTRMDSEKQIQNDEFTPTESEREIQNDGVTPTESEKHFENDEFTPTELQKHIENDEFTPTESEFIDPDMTTSRKIEVPSKRVGIIIGKAGDTIRNLQFNSGAKIQIVKDADADPNALTRDVELIGTISCINKAEQLIKDVLAEAYSGGKPALVAKGYGTGSGSDQVEMQIPNEKVGVVIGKGGQMIKDLQSRSGARIQLVQQQASEGDDAKERGVKISGSRHQIDAAKSMIRDVISQSGRPQLHHRQGNRQNHGSRGPSSGNNNWGPPRSNQNYNSYNNQQQRGGNYHSTPHSNYPQNAQQNYSNYPPPSRGWDQQRGAPMGGPGSYAPPQVQQGHGSNNAYQAPAQQMYQQAAVPAQQYYGQQSQTGYQMGFTSAYPYSNNMHQQGQLISGAPAQQPQYPYGPGPQSYAPQPGSDGYSQQYGQQTTGQVGQAGAGYAQAGQMGPNMYSNQAVQGNNGPMNWMGDQTAAAGYNNNSQAMGQMGQIGYGQAGQSGYGQMGQTVVGQVAFDQTAMVQPAVQTQNQGQVQGGQTPVAGQWQG